MGKPSVSLVMDVGPLLQRRETSCSRVSSPSAANTGAEFTNCGTVFRLRCLGKVLLDELHDHTPALLVRLECVRATLQRDLIEAGFGYGQHHAVRNFFESENNESGRFVRVIGVSFGWAWVPPKREKSLGFHAVNRDLKFYALVFLLSLGHIGINAGSYDGGADTCSRSERTVEVHTEPRPNLFRVCQCVPNPFARRAQQDLLLDTV